MRRILLLITDLQIGGTPTVVRELATRLNSPPDVVLDVACLSGPGPVSEQLKTLGINVFAIDARRATDIAAIIRLSKLIRANCYDTVFSFLIHANAAAAVIASFFPNVRFLQSIQTTQPYPRWHWIAQWVAQHAAQMIIVPSRSVAHVAQEWANIPMGKIVIIPNAIDINDFACDTGFQPVPATSDVRPSSSAERCQHGLKTRVTGRPVPIGFIGRLDPIKRIPDLLRAIKLLKDRVHLHLFGEGAERGKIEKLIAQLDLSSRVTLHGSIARPQDALSQISLLVLPSLAEGFGLVLIEAMAANVPVVSTDVPGICDVVKPDETGLLVPPCSPPALAEAIARLLDDAALREQLTVAAGKDVESRFTWDVVLPQYRALLGLS